MKETISLTLISILLLSSNVFAQSKKEQKVSFAVDKLRKAMVDGDSVMLNKLTANILSYGHSGGGLDNKQSFIQKLVSGKSDFVTMILTNQTISISKNTAIVRHKLEATTNDGGKIGEVHLQVLLIWQKLKGSWKLIARQAVKV